MLSIRQRQLNLRTYMYYYKGNIDGKEGILTKQAYRNFQKNNCLVVDGIYGINTENKLILCVKDLQNLLNKFGYNLVVDGIVGGNTLNAIKEFQRKNNLYVDGIVGAKTFEKLGTYNNQLSWKNIEFFNKNDFTCKCGCELNNIDLNIVKILDDIRKYYGKPIIVTSACRCEKHNINVGGKQGSKHTKGKAIDFYVIGVKTSELLKYCNLLVSKGIIRYTYTNSSNMNGVVHIDIN